VVAQARPTPLVCVGGSKHLKTVHEHVVQPPAAPVVLECPRGVARAVSVDRAESVDPAELTDQGPFGGVPALAALRTQAAVGAVSEGQQGAVGVLAPGRVEVAAEDPGDAGGAAQVRGDRLVSADLGQLRRRGDRGMDIDHLDPVDRAMQHPLGPRHRRDRKAAEFGARGGQDREATLGRSRRQSVERVQAERETHVGQRGSPQRRRSRRHLLQRDDVRPGGCERGRLLRLSADSPSHVPGDHPHRISGYDEDVEHCEARSTIDAE
jgi:hypothetical protein